MGFARSMAWRALLRRPARTVSSILGVALGIATTVVVFVLDHNTILGFSARGGHEWTPGLELRPAPGSGDVATELARTRGVAGWSRVFQNEVVLSAPPRTAIDGSREMELARVALVGVDAPQLRHLEAVVLADGRLLSPGRAEREVLVGLRTADAMGLKVGDEVHLQRPPFERRIECVGGNLRPVDDDPARNAERPRRAFKVVGLIDNDRLGRRAQNALVVADMSFLPELYEGAAFDGRWWVRHDPQVDLEELRTSLARSFSYELNKNVLAGAAADERAFRNGVRMAGLFALVLGLYVIFHTLSLGLVERVREVAVLRALGGVKSQVGRAFFLEALASTLVATALGLAGGLALARWLLQNGITTLGTGRSIDAFEVPWTEVSALAGLGAAVALIGSVWPLLRLGGADAVAGLRGEEALRAAPGLRGFHALAAFLLAALLPALYFVVVPVVGEAERALVGAILAGVALLALLVSLPLVMPGLLGGACAAIARPLARLFPFAGRMAATALRTSPARIAAAAAALALVAAAVVGLKGMTRSLSSEIDNWADRAIATKLYVRNLPAIPTADLRARLEPLDGFVAFEGWSARSYAPFLLVGIAPEEARRHGPLARDAALAQRFAAGGSVILSERLARQLNAKVGDTVRVPTSQGVQELSVLLVDDAYGYFPHPDERLYGVVSDRHFAEHHCLDTSVVGDAAIVLSPGADPRPIEAALRAAHPDRRLSIEWGPDIRDHHVADLARDFALFDLILGLTAVLAALGVLNGQLLAALERAKEVGILRALGASRRQVAGTVLIEALVTGALGGVVGTALGVALTPVVVAALASLSGLDLHATGPGPWLWIVPLGSMALAALASLYPMLHATRVDPTRAVRAP